MSGSVVLCKRGERKRGGGEIGKRASGVRSGVWQVQISRACRGADPGGVNRLGSHTRTK